MNVSGFGNIFVAGNPIFANVSGFGGVVGQQPFLRSHHFTRARASKWAKVSILLRRDAHPPVTSASNIIIYRIYCLFQAPQGRHYLDPPGPLSAQVSISFAKACRAKPRTSVNLFEAT